MSDSDLYGLIEVSFVIGLLLAYAVYELVSLRRARRRDDEDLKPPRP